MKVFTVIMVGRQVEGDYICIRSEKAFKTAEKAEELVKKYKEDFVTKDGKPKRIRISTNMGDVDCFCEIGVFEIDLEESE